MPTTKIEPTDDDKKTSKATSSSSSNKKFPFLTTNLAIALVVIVFIIGVIFIIIFAAAPCRFKTCHANATCINRPFNAKCKCNSGFNGNGIDCDECGVAYPGTVDASLANDLANQTGDPVPAFAYPASVFIQMNYVAYVQVGAREYETFLYETCDGILINRRTILTAASCVLQSYQFYIDDINQTVTVPVQLNNAFPEWEQVYNIFTAVKNYIGFYTNLWPIRQLILQDIIVHEKYQSSSLSYNIALIRLRDRIDLDQYVQLACIPDSNDLALQSSYLSYNKSAVTIGWEAYNTRGFAMFDKYALTAFSQNIMNVTDCSGLYTPDASSFLICAGQYQFLPLNASNGGGINCQGDIGGALYINRSYNGIVKNFAVGIMVNDTLCGLGVLTNLFNFVDWIADKSNY